MAGWGDVGKWLSSRRNEVLVPARKSGFWPIAEGCSSPTKSKRPLARLSGATVTGCPSSPSLLDRRTRHVCIGAEDATIALKRAKHFAAVLAVVEEPAGIHRHRLGRHSAALGTSERGSQLHHAPPSARISGTSIKPQQAEIVTNTVATHRRTKVLFAGGAVMQLASRTPARRFRI